MNLDRIRDVLAADGQPDDANEPRDRNGVPQGRTDNAIPSLALNRADTMTAWSRETPRRSVCRT